MTTDHNGDELAVVEGREPAYRVDGVAFDRTFSDAEVREHLRTVLRRRRSRRSTGPSGASTGTARIPAVG